MGKGAQRTLALFLLCCLFFHRNVTAEELDDVLSGFDEPETVNTIPDHGNEDTDDVLSSFETEFYPDETEKERSADDSLHIPDLPAWLDISGSSSLSTSLNISHKRPSAGETDHRDFSKFKIAADLTADIAITDHLQARIGSNTFYDFIYDLKGRNEFTDDFVDEYGKEFELTEVWLQGRLRDDLDFKAGRQIVVWGKSDNIRITDILNPIDNREPGLVDIKDLRLPVTMSKVDYYTGPWNISAMMIHEVRYNKTPVFGSDFYNGVSPLPPEENLSFSMENQQYALAINGIFSGWDLSFYGAHVFDTNAYIARTTSGAQRKHSRLNMAGMAINIAAGNWLFKSEAALLDGLRYSSPVGEKSRFDLLLGAEYTGFNETVISLEAANRHIFSFDTVLEQAPTYEKQDDFQTVLRINRDFYNDMLKVTGLFSFFGIHGENGAFQRVTMEYEVSNNTKMTAGLIIYQNGDKAAFRDIADNDRLFFEIRTYF